MDGTRFHDNLIIPRTGVTGAGSHVVYNRAMEYLRLLRHGNFAKLWFAQILSQVGQNLLNFALIILVYDLAQHTRFANSSVALLVIAFGLPALLIAPIAGGLVDRWDRKTVMVVSNVLRAMLVPLYLLAGHRLWLILILSFVVSSILQFFVPAEAATIPNTVPKRLLLAANSLFIFSLYAAFIVGYSASGPAVQFLGSRGPYLIVTVMMALAAILTSLLPPQPYTKPTAPFPRPDLIKDLRQSWQLINENAERFFAILQLTITQAVVSILITLAPNPARSKVAKGPASAVVKSRTVMSSNGVFFIDKESARRNYPGC